MSKGMDYSAPNLAVSLVDAPDPTVIPPEYGARPLRRRLQQRQRRIVRHMVSQPLTETVIPAGSLMSEQTLADIRAGRYVLSQVQARPQEVKRKLTYAERCRERHRAKKQEQP